MPAAEGQDMKDVSSGRGYVSNHSNATGLHTLKSYIGKVYVICIFTKIKKNIPKIISQIFEVYE